MKRLIIILFILLQSCFPEHEKLATENNILSLSQEELRETITDFSNNANRRDVPVIIVAEFKSLQREYSINDTIITVLTSSMSEHVKTPMEYETINEVPVLYYTGIEDVFKFDPDYVIAYESFLRTVFPEPSYQESEDGDNLQIPPNYNPENWFVYLLNNKVVKINKP